MNNNKNYKSVNELTANQFEELRQMMQVDVEQSDTNIPDTWYDDNGEFTDYAVKIFYRGTSFVDDDFLCTAHHPATGMEVAA